MAAAVVMQDSVEREGSGSLTGGEQVSAPQPAPCQQRQSRLPLSRVKALMKADPDVTMASQESVFVISKATESSSIEEREVTELCLGFVYSRQKLPKLYINLRSKEIVFELFIETIAKDAYIYAQQGKRKTLQRKDLDNAIDAIDEFAFLEGTLD